MNRFNQETYFQSQARARLTSVLLKANQCFVVLLVILLGVMLTLTALVVTRCHQIDGITLTGHRFQSYSLSCPSINNGLAAVHSRLLEWKKLIR